MIMRNWNIVNRLLLVPKALKLQEKLLGCYNVSLHIRNSWTDSSLREGYRNDPWRSIVSTLNKIKILLSLWIYAANRRIIRTDWLHVCLTIACAEIGDYWLTTSDKLWLNLIGKVVVALNGHFLHAQWFQFLLCKHFERHAPILAW